MPDDAELATLAAPIEMEPEGTLPGAVYKPVAEIVPTDALPPATPFTVQLTAGLLPFVVKAENC